MTTGWKRRSKAASFSICLRYSSLVVAPITWISPRAIAGFRIFDASIAPSAPPAPITVCSSSIKSKIFPAAFVSRRARLIRSSNSPRYFEPATMPDKSNVRILFCSNVSGTAPSTIRDASPSTIAVLPTPGSPIKHGLFFMRRLRIPITLSISSSRFNTGSSFPSFAYCVKSLAYWSNVGVPEFFLLRERLAISSFFACTISPPVVRIMSV